MGWNKTINDVKISGITSVNSDMISLAKKSHMEVKQLAVAKDGKLEVSLKMVPENSALALGGTLNGVYIDTEIAGAISEGFKRDGSEARINMDQRLVDLQVKDLVLGLLPDPT